jgi:hypothetical protein
MRNIVLFMSKFNAKRHKAENKFAVLFVWHDVNHNYSAKRNLIYGGSQLCKFSLWLGRSHWVTSSLIMLV